MIKGKLILGSLGALAIVAGGVTVGAHEYQTYANKSATEQSHKKESHKQDSRKKPDVQKSVSSSSQNNDELKNNSEKNLDVPHKLTALMEAPGSDKAGISADQLLEGFIPATTTDEDKALAVSNITVTQDDGLITDLPSGGHVYKLTPSKLGVATILIIADGQSILHSTQNTESYQDIVNDSSDLTVKLSDKQVINQYNKDADKSDKVKNKIVMGSATNSEGNTSEAAKGNKVDQYLASHPDIVKLDGLVSVADAEGFTAEDIHNSKQYSYLSTSQIQETMDQDKANSISASQRDQESDDETDSDADDAE